MTPANIVLLLCAGLFTVVKAEHKTDEEPLSLETLFSSVTLKFQDAVNTLENVTGLDIPSNEEELKTLLVSSADTLKENAKKVQKEISQFNGTSLADTMSKIQAKIDTTVHELSERNPDLGKLLSQVKAGFTNLTEVSKSVNTVVQEHASTAGENLKTIAEQARTHLKETADRLETTFLEYAQEKKSKTT